MNADRAAELAPKLEVIAGGRFEPTDAGNAERLVATHRHDLRYATGIGWLCWDGRIWQRDTDGEVMRRARHVARAMLLDAYELGDDDPHRKAAISFALKSEDARRLRAAIDLAATDKHVVIPAGRLDAKPFLLTCANGTLDLTSGELQRHERTHLLTRGTGISYDPDATCPRWQQFLGEIFDGDGQLVAFLQRWLGYCLTGDTSEHKLAVFHGDGANGKSTLTELAKRLLGDLATTAAFDTFARIRGDRGPRNDLARLRGARLVTASESGQGHTLDEATVKEVTGGDTIAARFLYGEHFEYRPAFKLVLVTNHRPHLDGGDDAIRRRVLLIPFERSFAGHEDRHLPARLLNELPGILTWAVQGTIAWRQHGLNPPASVLEATQDYLADEDVLGAFLTDHTTPGGRVTVAALRATYDKWCAANAHRPLDGKALTQALKRRDGITAGRTKHGRHYDGIQLRVTGDTSDGRFGNSPHAGAQGAVTQNGVTTRHPSPAGATR